MSSYYSEHCDAPSHMVFYLALAITSDNVIVDSDLVSVHDSRVPGKIQNGSRRSPVYVP